jgi:hypothetical protein
VSGRKIIRGLHEALDMERAMKSEHKGLPVAGYRAQPEDKVARVNLNKEMEELALRTLDELKEDPSVDQRWLAIGRTRLEEAWMAINRSIFKPGRVKLPGDPA